MGGGERANGGRGPGTQPAREAAAEQPGNRPAGKGRGVL